MKTAKGTIYGYARVSTKHQKAARQIDNIRSAYPEAIVITEEYTGTTASRPIWSRLAARVKAGDTIVFDEVSRMSRNAAEGFQTYQDLFQRGVKLIFLKEPHINTSVYQGALEQQIEATGNKVVDYVLEGVNHALMELARQQIEIAFQTAQAEVDFLHKRTREGVQRAILEGKQVGRAAGSRIETKKARESKKIIMQHAKAFGGSLKDVDVMKLARIERHTYYKYKRQLLEDMYGEGDPDGSAGNKKEDT